MQHSDKHSIILAIGLIVLLVLSLFTGFHYTSFKQATQNPMLNKEPVGNSIAPSTQTYVTDSPYGQMLTTETVGVQNGMRYQIIQTKSMNTPLTPLQQQNLQNAINQQQAAIQKQIEGTMQEMINSMPNVQVLVTPVSS